MKNFYILTIFPEFFEGFLKTGIVFQAIKKQLVNINTINLRDFSSDKHRTVDDVVYGGGPGMLLKPEPIFRAYEHIANKTRPYVLITEPWGRKYDQKFAQELAKKEDIMIICGRYEGIDERVKSIVDEEVSIGDYIMSGGEPAALVIMDSIIRLIPGVVGDENSLKIDSFTEDLLGYPNYTRPAVFKGMEVPKILRSGNHRLIKLWRRWKQIENTYKKRPELLKNANLTDLEKSFLEYIKNNKTFEDFIKNNKV